MDAADLCDPRMSSTVSSAAQPRAEWTMPELAAELIPLLQHLHGRNGETPHARRSTHGKCPNVSSRLRTSQAVSESSTAAASGMRRHPRNATDWRAPKWLQGPG